MQQVKFKDDSIEAAQYGNDWDYYLFAINGGEAVVRYLNGGVWRSHRVPLAAVEVATPRCVLPVEERNGSDSKWMLDTLRWLGDPESNGGITTCEKHNGHGFQSDCVICSRLRDIERRK